MKIILLYPPTGWVSNYNTPTGLLYIGTVLKNEGHNVILIDLISFLARLLIDIC